jgi:hypothetical protein
VTTLVAPGVLTVRATAPGCSLVTAVDDEGVHGHFEPAPGDEAILDGQIRLAGDGTFRLRGAITFSDRHSLRFQSLDPGRLSPSPDRNLRHGSVITEIEGGRGQFAGARGRITSNFFLSDTGELTDNQLGLLFIESAVSEAAPDLAPGGRRLLARQD